MSVRREVDQLYITRFSPVLLSSFSSVLCLLSINSLYYQSPPPRYSMVINRRNICGLSIPFIYATRLEGGLSGAEEQTVGV